MPLTIDQSMALQQVGVIDLPLSGLPGVLIPAVMGDVCVLHCGLALCQTTQPLVCCIELVFHVPAMAAMAHGCNGWQH